MIRRPPRSTLSSSSAASDVYKRQLVSAAALAALDVVPSENRSPVGQQSRRESTEAGGSPSQECAVLSHPERSAGRRSVHEPDPHLPVMRRELLRLLGRAAAPRQGTGRPTRGMDAMELSRDSGADCESSRSRIAL